MMLFFPSFPSWQGGLGDLARRRLQQEEYVHKTPFFSCHIWYISALDVIYVLQPSRGHPPLSRAKESKVWIPWASGEKADDTRAFLCNDITALISHWIIGVCFIFRPHPLTGVQQFVLGVSLRVLGGHLQERVSQLADDGEDSSMSAKLMNDGRVGQVLQRKNSNHKIITCRHVLNHLQCTSVPQKFTLMDSMDLWTRWSGQKKRSPSRDHLMPHSSSWWKPQRGTETLNRERKREIDI